MNNLEEKINEEELKKIDEIIQDEAGSEDEKADEEVSPKVKKRKDYITDIKLLCERLQKPCPVGIHQLKKAELIELLGSLTDEGILKTKMPSKVDIQEEYASNALLNMNMVLLGVCETLTYKYRSYLGEKYCKGIVKRLCESEERRNQLKQALIEVYRKHKDVLDTAISPEATLIMINISLVLESLTDE